MTTPADKRIPVDFAEPSFAELFTPKLITVLREGYGLTAFKSDLVAGLTVAIVALPLSMAIAIACGVTPDRGLYTAIVGGFLISMLGGSRFQIGGPAGAFIVLVATTVQRHGIDGLLLATLISGIFLVIAGFLRLGTYIKFIPYPVTVGFTAGIGIIIFTSQLKDFLGLTLSGPEPGPILDKLEVLAAAVPTASPAALLLAVVTVAIIVLAKRWRPGWPGMLMAVVIASLLALALGLPVETIGSRFGGIPRTLPMPALPSLSLEKIQAVLPSALAFALLGAIESLLSAVVADGMTGRRHRSNCELAAQGTANIFAALFGGVPATGTIARTATNVRAGARGPIAGMAHSVFLLLFMLLAAPLAAYIPLPALAGVLVVVAWNMIEKHAFAALIRSSRGDALVLLATFLLTVFRDLTEGIVVGFALGAMLFINRMAKTITVEYQTPLIDPDVADSSRERVPYDPSLVTDPDIVVYRISGAFFFGAASTVGAVLDRIADQRKALILDFSAVPVLDSTAANTIAGAARKAHQAGVELFITGTSPAIRRTLFTHGVRPPQTRFGRTPESAVRHLQARSADSTKDAGETAGSDPRS
ncbi:SulP family inorganic anion transporter [Afifella marina]|uniref:Sulfate permease, SulP family n=1 Tax=Afifella marina DSM 2698 TaxID=1120955 RepID=A0A1G5N474_AFIMA|nr:SulP family inorganic anion transporter [Afifella marina]MBK1622369.1 sodium-independent anion transporter [Afifella marina DSM 2698]MBK1626917.1 sodium-independent anion transporter [Afifella marina]MBK5919153.1 sodium-independent anion transporter [Afifella marina]RAI21203.1 sodium-independent anion transporter [Afifella marina DSM 2698]SCZ31718.1 sulfate permease, SulP family [Afifella marina DSM 2698]